MNPPIVVDTRTGSQRSVTCDLPKSEKHIGGAEDIDGRVRMLVWCRETPTSPPSIRVIDEGGTTVGSCAADAGQIRTSWDYRHHRLLVEDAFPGAGDS